MVTTDKKEYIHHTINLSNTSLPNKTIIKTTNKNGLGAIKPRQRPNRSPTNYLYIKSSNQYTHPQSIRREQPYVYTMHQNTSHGFAKAQNVIGANLRNTVNPEKLLLMVTTDKNEYIHHNDTIHRRNTSLPYKTINKTTNKNGLGAIKKRQRPNRSPTNYLYTKPSTQSTHPQSIRRFSRPSTRVQPYVYIMHQNPSHGFTRVQNVISTKLRNTENPEKLSIMVTTDKKEYIHHTDTIHRRNTSLPYKTINKTTNKNGLGAIKPRQRPNRSPTIYLYTKPSNQSTHPQSIRRFSRPSTHVQPCVYTMHQNPSHGIARVQNVIDTNLRNTVNPEKLSLMVTTDKKEYIHHNGTIHLRNTSLPYKTIIKTTNKNGSGAIRPRQRPNRSPTNYLYTKPSNQYTHPQSIRRVQPYVYTMHQNPSHGFAKAQNVIGAKLRNTVNPEKLLLMVTTDKNEYIHHTDTIHRRNTSLPYRTINKTTNKNGLGAIKPHQRPNRSPTNYLYTKPSTQSTHPQSIRRFSRPSTHVQPYVYTMHQNPSHGIASLQNVNGTQPQKHRKSRKVINNCHDR